MNQMIEFLYEQAKEKLKEDDLPIEARNVLVKVKNELAEILKEEFTLDDLPKMEIKIGIMAKELKELDTCLETKN